MTLNIPPSSTKLHMKYIRFSIGSNTVQNCQEEGYKNNNNHALFSIYNGDVPLYACGGGKDIPSDSSFNIISHKNTLQFVLTARSSIEYPGFLIKYEGKNMCK